MQGNRLSPEAHIKSQSYWHFVFRVLSSITQKETMFCTTEPALPLHGYNGTLVHRLVLSKIQVLTEGNDRLWTGKPKHVSVCLHVQSDPTSADHLPEVLLAHVTQTRGLLHEA